MGTDSKALASVVETRATGTGWHLVLRGREDRLRRVAKSIGTLEVSPAVARTLTSGRFESPVAGLIAPLVVHRVTLVGHQHVSAFVGDLPRPRLAHRVLRSGEPEWLILLDATVAAGWADRLAHARLGSAG